MNHRHLLSFAAFSLLMGAALPQARSQPVLASDANSAQADDLTHQGVDLLKKHQWAEAEALFRRAYALKQSYDIAGNLGLAEAALGKWRDAAEHLTLALATFPANGKPAHRDLMREKLLAAREQVTALTITVDTPGADVLVDGKSVGTSPLAGEVFVDAGMRQIDARLAGYATAHAAVAAAKGAGAEVKLSMVAVPAPPPTQPVPVAPERRSVAPGVVLGSVAGAALVTGIGLFVAGRLKLSTGHDLHDALVQDRHGCPAVPTPADARCDALFNTLSQANTFQKAGVGLMIGAGAAAIGTVIYFVAPGTTSGPLRVTPAVSPSAAGLVVSGDL